MITIMKGRRSPFAPFHFFVEEVWDDGKNHIRTITFFKEHRIEYKEMNINSSNHYITKAPSIRCVSSKSIISKFINELGYYDSFKILINDEVIISSTLNYIRRSLFRDTHIQVGGEVKGD